MPLTFCFVVSASCASVRSCKQHCCSDDGSVGGRPCGCGVEVWVTYGWKMLIGFGLREGLLRLFVQLDGFLAQVKEGRMGEVGVDLGSENGLLGALRSALVFERLGFKNGYLGKLFCCGVGEPFPFAFESLTQCFDLWNRRAHAFLVEIGVSAHLLPAPVLFLPSCLPLWFLGVRDGCFHQGG